MAGVDDYRHADCTLFRVPPLDISKLQLTLQKNIIDAWRSGQGAQGAISTITGDKVIIAQLRDQIEKELEFQRATKQKRIDNIAEGKKAETQEKYGAAYSEAEAHYNEQIQQTLTQQEEAEQAVRDQRLSWSASQSRVEDMRKRVEERIKALGGRNNLERLLEINAAVNAPLEEKKGKEKSPIGYSTANKEAEKPEEIQPIAEQQTPAKKYSHSAYSSSSSSQMLREPFLKKVWRILHYKLW
ncbi:MAG TPA: hypothetical protein VJK03_01655 [Candidatus Nanoarchaeia archaeon]|nr:hypothetical protein [Candidatus Nanoarchaeia archaeon]